MCLSSTVTLSISSSMGVCSCVSCVSREYVVISLTIYVAVAGKGDWKGYDGVRQRVIIGHQERVKWIAIDCPTSVFVCDFCVGWLDDEKQTKTLHI